jgi:hypothetical protein
MNGKYNISNVHVIELRNYVAFACFRPLMDVRVHLCAEKCHDYDLGLPTKKLAVIETEPILANNFYEATGPRNVNPSPKPSRTNKNAWSLVDELKSTYWGHRTINILGNYQDVLKQTRQKRAHRYDDNPL